MFMRLNNVSRWQLYLSNTKLVESTVYYDYFEGEGGHVTRFNKAGYIFFAGLVSDGVRPLGHTAPPEFERRPVRGPLYLRSRKLEISSCYISEFLRTRPYRNSPAFPQPTRADTLILHRAPVQLANA